MNRLHKVILSLLLVVVSLVSIVGIGANSATTNSFALNRKGQFVITQTAYLPDKTYLDFTAEEYEAFGLRSEVLSLNDPQDMFIGENDYIYIADTGNARIVVYDPENNNVVKIIQHESFNSPRGVFISNKGFLYVADSSAGQLVDGVRQGGSIFKMDLDGNLITQYFKPTTPTFANQIFTPKKVSVDNQDNMYIVGEGVFDGIIQLSSNGDFLGYFTKNVVQLTAKQRLQRWLLSDEQEEKLVDINPPTFSNVYVDKNGIKYTTSTGEDISNLKKHNTDGSSSIDTNWGIDLALVDVYTDDQGIIYAASDLGYIFILTSDGQFVFGLGTQSDQNVVGFYSQLSSIAVDSKGKIWTLDQDNAFLQSYTPTDYSNRIYNALTLYKLGKYEEAVVEWEEVLRLNQLSVLAHREIGRNLYSQGEYEEAMGHFILSGNRGLYSDAYWEVRNDQMQENLPRTLIIIFGFIFIYQIVKRTNKKYHYLDTPKKMVKKVTDIRPLNDVLYMFNFVKQPLDSFYYLKRKEKGSYKGASIIFAMFFFTYMLFTTSKGFIYQFIEPADLDLSGIILGFFTIILLFIVCNYLVTSINDGEGTLGEIYKGVMYSLMPLMVAMLLTTYLSYKLTYNEVIILDLVMSAGQLGTGLLIFLAVQELHNYTVRESIKSFLMTFLFMLIMGVLFAFVQIMGDQLIQFVLALFEEAIRNVFS